MRIPFKDYYINLNELMGDENLPVTNTLTFKSFVESVLSLSAPYTLNINFALNDSNVEKLWQLCFNRYFYNYCLKVSKRFDEEPTSDDWNNALYHWVIKLINAISLSYDYYNTLLVAYAGAQANLMDDITATSKNKVKFNDTPQNPNNLNVYEGDDYITHFTATEGETTSPLMSKMLRLKEIQDHYRDVMDNWVEHMRKCWFEGSEV